MATAGNPTEKSNALIEEAIETFDKLIVKVNEKNVADKKAHFKKINKELEESANQLVAKINVL